MSRRASCRPARLRSTHSGGSAPFCEHTIGQLPVPLEHGHQALQRAETATLTALSAWKAADTAASEALGVVEARLAAPAVLTSQPEAPFLRPADPVLLVGGVRTFLQSW